MLMSSCVFESRCRHVERMTTKMNDRHRAQIHSQLILLAPSSPTRHTAATAHTEPHLNAIILLPDNSHVHPVSMGGWMAPPADYTCDPRRGSITPCSGRPAANPPTSVGGRPVRRPTPGHLPATCQLPPSTQSCQEGSPLRLRSQRSLQAAEAHRSAREVAFRRHSCRIPCELAALSP